VVAFVMIGALPTIDRLMRKPLSRAWWIAAPLFAYSLWFQISGATLHWEAYGAALPAESGALGEWWGGLYDPRYFRPVVMTGLWGQERADIAWAAIDAPVFGLAFAGIAFVGLWMLIQPRARRFASILPISLAVVLGVGLVDLYARDGRVLSGDDSLHALLPILEAETHSEDAILLSSPRYYGFFANYAKLWDAGRIIALPMQPGERPSPDQMPLIESDFAPALLTNETIRLIHNLAETRDRIWLITDGNPTLSWSVRPVERFLSAYYYPLRRFSTGNLTWLIEYSSLDAPDPFAFRAPERRTDLVFGDTLHLSGVEFPAGMRYHPGDALAVSLHWISDDSIEADYTIALYVRDSAGSPVVQVDSKPAGGFAPTSAWTPGVPVWDNRAVRLPDDLAPATYQLWVKVYELLPDLTPRDLPVTAGVAIDGTIGILPYTIEVTNDSDSGT
jgi:hypothetical protein